MVMVKPALAYLDVIARAARRVRRAGGGVPRERRVRDARRPPPRTAGSTATPSRSSTLTVDQAGRRRLRAHVPRPRSRRTPRVSYVSDAVRRAPRRASPAGSTRRCGRSRRSAASRSSSPGPRAPYLVDTEGRRYVDYVQSWGASILGHAHPAVVEAVQRAAADGHVVRRADRARGRAGRGDRRAGAVGRQGAPRVVGHRGGDDRGPPRPRRDRPVEDPEVRRLLPRPRRRPARRRGQRRRHPRAARLGRRHRRAPSPTPWSSPTTTTPRSTPRSTATAPSSRR